MVTKKKIIKNGTIIQCARCGKEIESKMGRTLCIRCSNLRDRELAEQRRKNPEYHKMYMKKYKRKKEA